MDETLELHGHQHVLMEIVPFWLGFQKALGFLIAEVKLDLLTVQSRKKIEQVLGIKPDPHRIPIVNGWQAFLCFPRLPPRWNEYPTDFL